MAIQHNKKVNNWAKDILSKMTLKEKVLMLSGKDDWSFAEIKRLGIPSIGVIDGPHGVRYCKEKGIHNATSFPTGISFASTWDKNLIIEVGKALGEETDAYDCDILLGPCVNIMRTPLAGRNFESYSEDPFLAGVIGTSWVNGIQSKNIGASLKHFACNNQEYERMRGDSVVDERTLREIYLPAFEMIVKEANPWTVMCAYNRLNGLHASENKKLLTDILKEEWGFEGLVVSDWTAVHSIFESVEAGLDIEMPGPAKYFGNLLEDAVNMWQIEESVIDKAVIRILKIIDKSGRLNKNHKSFGKVNSKQHQNLAKKVAEESIVLLKNDKNLLPIDKSKVKSIAVIGYNAYEARLGGGGSSYLEPPYRISPLQAIYNEVGDNVKIDYELGCDNYDQLTIIPCDYFQQVENKKPGVITTYYDKEDCNGDITQILKHSKISDMWWNVSAKEDQKSFSSRWETQFIAPITGKYAFQLKYQGKCKLYIEDNLLLDVKNSKPITRFDSPENSVVVYLDVVKGKSYNIILEYTKSDDVEQRWLELLGSYSSKDSYKKRIEKAANVAKKSDITIVFAGMPKGFESEGEDRPNMDLPGHQNELIKSVAKVNKNIIVVLNTGVPVTMPWVNNVSSIVEAFYPGMEGGTATSNILFGKVNPSGKLTVTFPKKYEDNPTYLNYPGERVVRYEEGLYVGYRYYDKKGVVPLFPFGHGLSYTNFEYSNLKIKKNKNEYDYSVSVDVQNTGKYEGKEIIQLYVNDLKSTLHRPEKELKGFEKVLLQPNETKTISLKLNKRSFAFYDTFKKNWIVEAGDFNILIANSSKNIKLNKIIEIK